MQFCFQKKLALNWLFALASFISISFNASAQPQFDSVASLECVVEKSELVVIGQVIDFEKRGDFLTFVKIRSEELIKGSQLDDVEVVLRIVQSNDILFVHGKPPCFPPCVKKIHLKPYPNS